MSSSCLRILNLWISLQIKAEKLCILVWLIEFYYLLYLMQQSLHLLLNIVGLVLLLLLSWKPKAVQCGL